MSQFTSGVRSIASFMEGEESEGKRSMTKRRKRRLGEPASAWDEYIGRKIGKARGVYHRGRYYYVRYNPSRSELLRKGAGYAKRGAVIVFSTSKSAAKYALRKLRGEQNLPEHPIIGESS